jgi:hypothetical protein
MLSLALCIPAIAVQQAIATTPHADREWVVRDVIPALSHQPGVDRKWSPVAPVGDLDGDLASDFLATYDDIPASSGVFWQGMAVFTSGVHSREEIISEKFVGQTYALDFNEDQYSLLNSPYGRLILAHGYQNNRISTWLPNDIIFATAAQPYGSFLRFPDINGDGFDEVVVQVRQSPSAITALLDGLTLTEIWRDLDFEATEYTRYRAANVEPWPDLNSDGSPDVIACWPRWLGGPISAVVIALDGITGQRIWRHEEPGSAGLFPCADGPDLTGDGVSEVLLALSGTVSLGGRRTVLLDGATGNLLWTSEASSIQLPSPLSGFELHYLTNAAFVTSIPGDPVGFDACVDYEFRSTTGTNQKPNRFLHHDARSGRVLGWSIEPWTLEPWYPDSIASGNPNVRFRLGDVDRDGVIEVAVRVGGLSIDKPGNQDGPWHIAILGLKTLDVPDAISPGESLEARVMIPSAPLHDFTLLLSQSFDASGGQRVDGWRTFLVNDSLLQSTLSGRYRGTLDAHGVGTLTVQIPNNPALAGTQLYSKAVIPIPGAGMQVWTMSSLGITEIQ